MGIYKSSRIGGNVGAIGRSMQGQNQTNGAFGIWFDIRLDAWEELLE
jgi:hypothetical protein